MTFDAAALDKHLSYLVESQKLPGVAVCITGPNGIVFEKGYGVGSFEKPFPIKPDTMFGIASMSKSTATLACSILACEGKLSWDDPVIKYFPTFEIKGTPKDTVLLKHLAMHNAGIPTMEPLEWSIACNTEGRTDEETLKLQKTAPNKMDKIEQIVDYIRECGYKSLGAPGEYMSYCNEGYALLSYVVDIASGTTLEKFLDERVFKPLGMTRTVLDYHGEEAVKIAGGNITRLFTRDEKGNFSEDDAWSHLPPFRSCACVKSTAQDITKYYQCLASNGVYQGKQVIPSAAVEMMVGREFPETYRPYYCYGLNKRTKAGHVICEHAGGLHGVSSFGGFLKDEGYGFAALCNEGGQEVCDMVWAMINAVIGLPVEESHRWSQPVGRDFSQPEMLVGKFVGNEGLQTVIESYVRDGKLYIKNGAGEMCVNYCGGMVFNCYRPANPQGLAMRAEFYVHDGVAWALRCGTRMFLRAE